MWQNQSIQVVLPAFNEEQNIYQSIREFYAHPAVDEVIVVDNNSTDNTKTEILKTKAKYIFETTKGYGSALIRGLNESTADIVITCEPDGTFIAEDIDKLLVYAKQFNVIFGNRTSKEFIWEKANMKYHMRIANVMVAKLLEYLFNGPCLTDVGCTFKLIKRDSLNKILPKLKVHGSHFSPEFMINSILYCEKVVEIPLNYNPRIGESKITGNWHNTLILGITMVLYILKKRCIILFKK